MMKKEIRQKFRDECHRRDRYGCVTCGFKSSPIEAEQELDVHHIINRNLLPNGGYVKENGISLCSVCHMKAEEYYSSGTAVDGFSIEELLSLIGSSFEKAEKNSQKLK